MTRYLSEEEPTGKITITHEEAMRELGKIEDDYSEIRQLKKQIAEMHQADLNRLATIEELVRCLENAIKFVYHYYGDNKEALADMETSTWRTIVKTFAPNKACTRLRLRLGRSVPLARSVALLSALILLKRRAGNANR